MKEKKYENSNGDLSFSDVDFHFQSCDYLDNSNSNDSHEYN